MTNSYFDAEDFDSTEVEAELTDLDHDAWIAKMLA